ncbi:MAG: hypothetical protein ABSA40_04755 [Candidatus Dormibacteria bacterium]|jgi:hypothetical protein
MDGTPRPLAPRPLSAEERSILDRLLDVGFPGSEALRAQLPFVSVVGACPCGCVTRHLAVDRGQAPPAQGIHGLIPAEARIPARGSDHGGGVLVFAKDGYLCTLEAYSHDGEPIRTWPAPQLMTFTVPR